MARLDKVLGQHQFGSRSQLKKLIRKEGCLVNSHLVFDESYKIRNGDLIEFLDVQFKYFEKVYLMMNKQKDRECSHDAYGLSVYDDLDDHTPNDLFTIGRLDKDTTGLLILTNDGQYAHQITQKNNNILKRYLVSLDKEFNDSHNLLFQGIDLGEDGVVVAKTLEIIDKDKIILGISDGKYHQVKRMIHALDNDVLKLHRMSIGKLSLDESLKPGQNRSLTQTEIEESLCSED